MPVSSSALLPRARLLVKDASKDVLTDKLTFAALLPRAALREEAPSRQVRVLPCPRPRTFTRSIPRVPAGTVGEEEWCGGESGRGAATAVDLHYKGCPALNVRFSGGGAGVADGNAK